MKIACRQCAKAFDAPRRSGPKPVHCSDECRTAEAAAKGHPPWTPKRPDTPCSGCGELMWSSKVMAAEPMCHPCRRKARQRVCSACGTEFRAAKADAKYCSRSCWSASRKGVSQGPPVFKNPRPCVDCGTDVLSSATAPRCPPCREAYMASAPYKGRYAAMYRDKCRRRRALKRGVPSEQYTTEEIAERDGFVCQLCGEPVVMSTPYPDSWSPSIDHIQPLSRGGDDTKANVQLAHRFCNTSKGNRVPA